ncbi:hypothetical protein LINPERHAP1_LOCUS9433 [Linum perenne]
MYRPFITCDDPKGILECGTITKSKYTKMASHKHQKKNSTAEGNRQKKLMNKVIDSWSQEKQDGHGSKDIVADDFLKGALDLKHSLVMLGKLQDASNYMAKLKQKQRKERENFESERLIEGFPSLRTVNSCREYPTSHIMVQNPRLSVDGGVDYIDELRMAITNSFDRQNLLSAEERPLHYRRKRDETMSQSNGSSKVQKKEKSTFYSSSSSSNVIARLMGLEDIQPPQSPPRICTQKRIDIDVPNYVRKLQHKENYFLNTKEADTQQRSLKELLETMEFRGLLKKSSTSVKDFSTHQPNKQLFPVGIPPVVLIKPFCMPQSEISIKGEVLSSNVILRKVKDDNCTPGMSYQQGGLPEASNIYIRERRSKNWRSKRIGEEEERVKTVVQREGGHIKCKKRIARKLGSEDAGGKSVTSKNRAYKEQKGVVPRVKEGIKSNAKVIVDRKVDKIKKMGNSSNEAQELKDTLKVTSGSRVEDKTKVETFREMRNSGNGRIGSTSITNEQQGATRNAKARKQGKNEEEKEKLVDEVKEAMINGSQQTCREEEEEEEEETDSSAWPLEEHCTKCNSNVPSHRAECGNPCSFKATRAEDSKFKCRIIFKTFLLRSREFLIRAEQLFPIMTGSSYPNELPALRTYDTETSYCMKLSLDYAKELMECRSRSIPYSQGRRHCYYMLPTGVTLDEVVEEVCNGVDALEKYNKLNSVNSILERDIKSTGVIVSRVWELGWRNGLCMDEAEEVVIELDKLILNHLIEEVFT